MYYYSFFAIKDRGVLMQDCKCSHCTKWVFCKTKGFCLVKDLFTYTELEEDAVCPDFVEGEPQTEEEFESAQLF